MKILLLPTVCVLALTLSGCSLLSSAGSMLNVMVNALGRTVSQADTPGSRSDTDAVAQRGSEIAAKGTFGGAAAPAAAIKADTVAHR